MRMHIWALILLGSAALAAEWSQWRGPYFNGSTDAKNLPAVLDPNQTLLWKTPMPGKSSATPVIAAGKVYLASTENSSDRLLAMCLDAATGRVLWQYTAARADKTLPSGNTMASCSPCAQADGAVFLFGEGTLVKLDTSGKEIWKRNLVADYGPLTLDFGFSSSPLLLEERLYIPVLRRVKSSRADSAAELDSYLLCVNAADGKTIFRQTRPTDAREESTNAYTTPLPVSIAGKMHVVVYGADCVTGHDPQTGKELWRYTYITDKKRTIDRQIPTPVAADGILVCSWPRGDRTFALDLDKLAANEPSQVWRMDQPGSDITCAAVYQGNVYQIAERNKTLTCLNPRSGQVHWTAQLDRADMYYASIAAGDGKLYLVNRQGVVTIAAADPAAFRVLSTHNLGEQPVDSSIIIADNKVFLRTAKNLYCYGTTK